MITSKTNKDIIYANSLKNNSARSDAGQFLLEGKKLISEAGKQGYTITHLFFEAEQEEFATGFNCNKIEVSKNLIEYLSDTVTPQGVFAIVDYKLHDETNSNFIVLDNIQDPGNVGSILRTALATDFKTVYSINSADPYSLKVIRSSAGSVLKLNIISLSLPEFLNIIKNKNCKLVVADLNGENIFKSSINGEFGIIFGNEGNGVSSALKEKADLKVTIPMKNNLESLNVSVSAGLIMYLLSRRVL